MRGGFAVPFDGRTQMKVSVPEVSAVSSGILSARNEVRDYSAGLTILMVEDDYYQASDAKGRAGRERQRPSAGDPAA